MRNKVGGLSLIVRPREKANTYGCIVSVIGISSHRDSDFTVLVNKPWISRNGTRHEKGTIAHMADWQMIPISDPDQIDQIKREILNDVPHYKHSPGPHKEVV